jgi:hypothetical protein
MVDQEESFSPSFFNRVLQVFVSPGELFCGLREKPVWGLALTLGGVLVGTSLALIPADLWVEFAREQMLEQGREAPASFGGTASVMRISSILGGLAGWFVWAFVLAGFMTLVLAFLLGDEGRYRQYLSVVSHALLISALGALLTVPLKIAQADPSLTLSLGTFTPFLPEGYLLRFLRMLDLFALWGYGVMALGASKIDPRRSAGSAAAVLYGLAVAMALAFAPFGS